MKEQYFYAAMYLRLSRDNKEKELLKDGAVKGSIANQREIIKDYISKQPDIELYDVYTDNGFTGSNFNRPEFKRMIADIEAGRINCVIVKDLSRFGRDYIETGRYIQKIFPLLGVRFIALSDNYDSLYLDNGKASIILPVKNFINDSYCRDISVKVKSVLEVKRKNGECVSPFAVYGYLKDTENKNHLIIDNYAAFNVKNIFRWKINGMAVSAIAKKLNSLGTLSPREYKKSIGIKFNGGFYGTGISLWNSASVKRILTNEVYLGHLVQGKSQKINYKVKKNIAIPEDKWIRVENTHKAIITEDDFNIVQNLLKSDSRQSPDMKEAGKFSCLLFCGDCGEQMVRRINRYKGNTKVYYICSTKNRGKGCSRHSIEETVLDRILGYTIKKYINIFFNIEQVSYTIKRNKTDCDIMPGYNKEIMYLKKEHDKYHKLCLSVKEDFKKQIITEEEFTRLYKTFSKKEEEFIKLQKKQENLMAGILEKNRNFNIYSSKFKNFTEFKEIDHHTLSSLVKKIYIYEDKRINIEFYFTDIYKTTL